MPEVPVEAIAALRESGPLQPHIDRTFPLEAVADAHRWAESGKAMGAVMVATAARHTG